MRGYDDAQIARCTWCSWTARSPWLLRALQKHRNVTLQHGRVLRLSIVEYVYNVSGKMHVQEWDTRCDVFVYIWHCSLLS